MVCVSRRCLGDVQTAAIRLQSMKSTVRVLGGVYTMLLSYKVCTVCSVMQVLPANLRMPIYFSGM